MSLTEEVSFDKEGRVEPDGWRSLIFRRLFLAFIILLASSLSFGLGRLSAVGERSRVTVELDPALATPEVLGVTQAGSRVPSASSGSVRTGEVVASSKSDKYHYPHCPGAKQITEANKVIFASPEAAEASGYTLAGNCSPR